MEAFSYFYSFEINARKISMKKKKKNMKIRIKILS